MSKANILIVEDEAVVAADLASKLERAGYHAVGIASDGEEAVETVQVLSPDLILMDIRLAGRMDGIEAAERIRSIQHVPVVYLTAHSDVGTLKRAVNTEPFGYILKPFEERDLTTQIEIALYKAKAEQRLRDSEERYRKLVDSAMDSIITFDERGTILSCNPATERMFNYRSEDLVNGHVSVLIPAWTPAGEGAEPASPVGNRPTAGLWQELSARRRHDERFPAEIAVSERFSHGGIVYTGILRDVSERKRTEGELRWRAGLLEQSHDAVLVWRIGSGIIYWNRGAAELYGWTVKEAAGRTVQELLGSVFPIPTDEFYRRLVEHGHWHGEIRHCTKEGKTVIVDSRMVTMDDQAGTLVLETNRDVTERHAIHQEVCRLAEELERRVEERTRELVQSQKLLRELASELTVAEQRERRKLATDLHDYLAQLLVAVRLKVSQAHSRLSHADVKRWLAEAEEILQQALDYTRSLVAQLTPMALHEFGLPAALKWLGDQMAQQYRLTVSVECDELPAPLPEDRSVLVYQSIRELLMNVSKHARVDQASVRMSVADDRLRVTVRDDGAGSDQDGSRPGLSAKFGLFSIKERMTALGGWFAVESAPGKGTTATLELPLGTTSPTDAGVALFDDGLPAKPAADSLVPAPDVSGSRLHENGKIRVLLVDDHDMVRKGLASVLADHPGMLVVGEAADGEEAVALAAELEPHVVIMDVNMPKMDGVEASRRIKHDRPSTVIIGLSMHDSGQHEVKMRASGASAYLTKDAPPATLTETILRFRAAAAAANAAWETPSRLRP
ncbi:MAG TPA: response regulator [Nitrospira sp.]|nr:response regulator [Nitrospira sp.]